MRRPQRQAAAAAGKLFSFSSPRQRRLAPLALLLLLASLVLLALSMRTEVDVSSASISTTPTSNSKTSFASSSLRLPPVVAAFHARLDDLKLGAFNPGVVAASLREALAGGQGSAASSTGDDDVDVNDGNGASSSSSSFADPGLSAAFSALVKDIRAASSPLLECNRDETLPALASLRIRKEQEEEKGEGEESESERKLERPRLLLSANLKDSAAVLPHWLLSALGTGARLPRDSFFLSVVESGSEDGGKTRAWLSLLARLSSLAEIRAWVAADASRRKREIGEDRISYLAGLRNAALSPLWSRGPVVAGASAARAELTARRRRAEQAHGRLDLAALLDFGAERAAAAAAEEDGESPSSTSTSAFSSAFGEANRVAFVNDVFFCPDDVTRLLAHTAVSFVDDKKKEKEERGEDASSSSSSSSSSLVPLPVPAAGPADLACGLDLYRDGRKGLLRGLGVGAWKGVPGEEILPWGELGPPLDEKGVHRRRPRRRRRDGRSRSDLAPAPPAPPAPPLSAHDSLLLYDVWVSRDANGLPLSSRPPFARHQYSIDRASTGLPFPVACCWNGLAAFSATPFFYGKAPLRFRAASGNNSRESRSEGSSGGGSSSSSSSSSDSGSSSEENENAAAAAAAAAGDCPGSSECSLFCSDLHALGKWRAVLDPGVRVSYDAGTAARAREGRKVAAAAAEEEKEAASSVAYSPPPPPPPPIPSVLYSSWKEIQNSEPLDWGFTPSKFHLTCCPKGGQDDDVVHWEGCSWGGRVKPLERKMKTTTKSNN